MTLPWALLVVGWIVALACLMVGAFMGWWVLMVIGLALSVVFGRLISVRWRSRSGASGT